MGVEEKLFELMAAEVTKEAAATFESNGHVDVGQIAGFQMGNAMGRLQSRVADYNNAVNPGAQDVAELRKAVVDVAQLGFALVALAAKRAT